MKIEELIGSRIAGTRTAQGMTQAELGERVGRYFGRPWSRQTVSAAEKGGRAFTALELLVIAIELETAVYGFFVPHPNSDSEIETPGGAPISAEQLIKHVTAGPEQQQLVDQYTRFQGELADIRREADWARKRINELEGSELPTRITKGVLGAMLEALNKTPGGSSVSAADLISTLEGELAGHSEGDGVDGEGTDSEDHP